MPPNVHAAVRTATEAAAHLRTLMAKLAEALAQDDAEALVVAARALVQGTVPALTTDSPDAPEPSTTLGPDEGEFHE